MCGIFGVLDTRSRPDEAASQAALALMAHRGPDGDGLWSRVGAPFVTLGHRRLAIIDLSDAGAQPMASEDGALVLTFNGEIYNYVELMSELEALGHRFRSHSDTEVLLRAYAEWGEGCLDRLNGMFAFAVWDERRQELFAARDRFGEKPFHYAWDEAAGRFAFASEVKSLLALPGVDGSLDDRALYRFIAFQELAGSEQTLWRGVRRLPHAHFLRARARADGSLAVEIRRYWDLDLSRVEPMSLAEGARRFAELFADSVRIRLRSDVPVGTSLSGGLDSSAVVCQIHALGAAGGQKTFSARMDDPLLDEGRFIRAVLDRTGVEGHEVWPSFEELESLFGRLCYHLEEPFLQTSQFAQHLVMRLAADNDVTVLLDGQGADELLAGYTPYFLVRYGELAAERRFGALAREWRGFRARHPREFPLNWRSLVARAAPGLRRGLHRSIAGGEAAEPRRGPAWGEMAIWWDRDWLEAHAGERPPETRAEGRDALTRRLYHDTMEGELQELLRYGDRNSMAWSREVRQPFLDHRLAELLFALPPDYKLVNGETKVVMREAVRGLIPEEIVVRQDKLGYQAPLPKWIGGPLHEWAGERLERAESELDGRLARGARERFERLPHPLGEYEARPIFSVLTIAESRRRMRDAAGDAASARGVARVSER